jgi:YT521-B-like domain/RNA recognition motif. (a.k.a. RRM, RBD, or RNP domain)
MAQMGSALPDYVSPQHQQYPHQMQPGGPPPIASASTPTVVYQLQQTLQYPLGATYVPPPGYVSYPQPQHAPGYAQPPGGSQTEYAPYQQRQHRQGVMAQGLQDMKNPGQYYYCQDAYWRSMGLPTGYSSQDAQFLGVLRPGQPVMPNSRAKRPSRGPIYSGQYIGEDIGKILLYLIRGITLIVESIAIRLPEQQDSAAAVPKGPPRKPKQSGHALWVGNLPLNATIWALKDHFSQDFTRDIESLFLISKSNCAFVNYRSEEACTRAKQKFHDSWFEAVRLVCRLRTGSAATSDAPTGPDAMIGAWSSQASSSISSMQNNTDDPPEAEVVEPSLPEDRPRAIRGSNQFFILKSLTLQDLEQSVRNGIWATQSQNEEALNKAYDVSSSSKVLYPLANQATVCR